MENDVLDALSDIGYNGPLLSPEALEKALESGPKSTDYTGLVYILSNEIKDLCHLEEAVSETSGPEEASHFVLELSSFLKELGCPYLSLVTGHMSSRLQSRSDRLLLLDYLLSELMTARMLSVNKPQEIDTFMEVTIQETPTAKDLNTILSVLKMTQPPANIATNLLFNKLKEKLKSVIQQKGPELVGRPLYNQAVTEKQWKELEELHNKLVEEYKLRRDMLITRLDCTIQSFEWKGVKNNDKHSKIQTVYRPLRQQMKVHPSIKLSDFLASRTSLLAMRKTSDAAVRINTRSEVNKVVIGRVPDRGGRPSEQQPPPPDMPFWQQQRSQGGGGGRGGGQAGRGGGSGFGGGSRVQGGWNQPMDQRGDQRGGRNQGNKDGGRGGYQGGYQGNNQGGYQGNNQGGYQGNNQGGYQSNNQGSHQGNNQGSYQGNNQGGYQGSNQGGYQSNNRGGYQDNNRGGYQDNRNSRGGYQDNRDSSGGYAGSKTYVVQNDQYSSNPSQGYQQGYQSNQGYQQSSSNQGYQSSNRGRGGGGVNYQNEHDDRTNTNYDRGGSGRGGRSNYNRGGRR